MKAKTKKLSVIALETFAAQLKERNARLRAGCKVTVNTETFKLTTLHTIEMRVGQRKWLPLKMPNNEWYFTTESSRDRVLHFLTNY